MLRTSLMMLVVSALSACAEPVESQPTTRFVYEVHEVEPGVRCVFVRRAIVNSAATTAVDCWKDLEAGR